MCGHICFVSLSLSLSLSLSEMEGYSIAGEEHVVPDMHTRKKMLFDKVSHSPSMILYGLPKMSLCHSIYKVKCIALNDCGFSCLNIVQADMFIALPGGIGTMEELTEILTWSKLNLHHKPVGLLNVNGYYDFFLQWVRTNG